MSDEPVSGVIEAAASGDRRRTLEAVRDHLARTLTEAEPQNAAAIAKQLRETVAELAELPDGQEVDAVDELAARRAVPAEAEVPQRPARARKRRTAGD